MTGSLTVKGGKYYAVLNIYENGKRKPKWINSGLPEKGNKRKAEAFLREKIAEYERMEGIVQTDILFADYIRHWLTHIARKVDEVTMQGYKTLADGHILPYFDQKKVPVRSLDHTMIQRYMDEKYQNGRLDGKGGLSPRSLRLHKNIISQALDLAVQSKLIPANPCQFVELPQNVRYESTFYNAKQLQDLFKAFQGDELLPLVKITALYGLRRSELLGLQWDSIDFERKTMTIRHTVSKVTEVVAKDKTKNASSRRSFPLTAEAEAIFRRAKEKEQQNRAAFGREYQENSYIFKWPDGHPYSPDYISHHFAKVLKKHGLPHIRFHELRHSCASMLLDMGFTLKDVQEWLGHSDIKMTANIYAHLDTARKNTIADSLAGKFRIA
jgi:integrase